MIKREKTNNTEMPLASLADIAFLLLIFFLVTTTIDVDTGIGLTLPDGKKTPIPAKNIANLLINQEGEILLDNETIQIKELNRLVRQRLTDNPNLIFSVKTDKKTKYSIFIQVLDELKIANASRISIAEPEE